MDLVGLLGKIKRQLGTAVAVAFGALLAHYVHILYWRKTKRLPPGPTPLPLLGNLLLLKSDDVQAELRPLFEKYGPVFSFWFGNKFAIIQSDPATDFELMVTRVDDFNARPKTEGESIINYQAGECEGIHSSEGKQWNAIRKILVQDLLSKSNLETRILPNMTEGARKLVKYIRPMSGTLICPRMMLKITAMNSTMKMIFDQEISYDDLGTYNEETNTWTPPSRELSKAAKIAFFFFNYIDSVFLCLAASNVRDVMPWPLNALVPRPAVFKTFFRLAKERTRLWNDHIAESRKTMVKGAPRHWVDEILENPRGLKDEEIAGLLTDTMIATSDTFIAFVEWFLGLCAQYPEEQKKMQAELDAVAPDRLIDAKDQLKCPYVGAFMKEVFRSHTLTPINPPRRAMVDTELSGYEVPADTWIFQHWGAMHLREDLWGADAKTFRPQRFLEEGSFAKDQGDMAIAGTAAPTKPCSLGMFSFGKRSCPGYRLGRVTAFLQCAMMIQLYDWELGAPGDYDLTPQPRLITPPKKLKIVCRYRHKVAIETLLGKPADTSDAWL